MRIAVLGGGVMGTALAAGFAERLDPAPSIVIAEQSPERADELAATHEVAPASEAVVGADVVLVAVKPQDVGMLLDAVADRVEPGALLISIAAGVRTAMFEAVLPDSVSVVRAMPNTPARIGAGTTGISAGTTCTAEHRALAARLMSAVGDVVEVPESLQDAVTATSGSGPAYVFLLAESMIAAAEGLGLSAEDARVLVHGTVRGAAELLAQSGDSASELRHKVTSPKGTTAAAIGVLEAAGMPEAVAAAMRAARDRGAELSGA